MGRLADRLAMLVAAEKPRRSVSATALQRFGQASARLMQTPQRPHVSVYLRNEREIPTLGAFARRVLAGLQREHQPFARISRAWAQIAPDVAAHTEVIGFTDGLLEIAVDNAPLRSELQGFRSHSLVAALQASPAGCDVAEIHFTLRRSVRREEKNSVRQTATSRRPVA